MNPSSITFLYFRFFDTICPHVVAPPRPSESQRIVSAIQKRRSGPIPIQSREHAHASLSFNTPRLHIGGQTRGRTQSPVFSEQRGSPHAARKVRDARIARKKFNPTPHADPFAAHRITDDDRRPRRAARLFRRVVTRLTHLLPPPNRRTRGEPETQARTWPRPRRLPARRCPP